MSGVCNVHLDRLVSLSVDVPFFSKSTARTLGPKNVCERAHDRVWESEVLGEY